MSMSKSILPFNQVYQNATLLASNLDSFFVLSTDDKIETVKQEGLFLYSQAVIDAQSYSMTMIPHIYENMLSTARGTELYIIIRRNIADDLNKALKEAAKSGSINMCKHVLESASYLEIEKSYVLSGAFKTAAYEQKFDVAIYLLKEMQNISDLDPRETEFWVSYGPHMDDDDYITAFEWACLNGYHDFADKLCHFDLTRPAKSFFTADNFAFFTEICRNASYETALYVLNKMKELGIENAEIKQSISLYEAFGPLNYKGNYLNTELLLSLAGFSNEEIKDSFEYYLKYTPDFYRLSEEKGDNLVNATAWIISALESYNLSVVDYLKAGDYERLKAAHALKNTNLESYLKNLCCNHDLSLPESVKASIEMEDCKAEFRDTALNRSDELMISKL